MPTRAADDFEAIKTRLEELRKQENTPVTTEATEGTPVDSNNSANTTTQSPTVDDPFCYYAKHPINFQQGGEQKVPDGLWEAQKRVWDFYHQQQAHQKQVEAKEQPIGMVEPDHRVGWILGDDGYHRYAYYASQNLDVKD